MSIQLLMLLVGFGTCIFAYLAGFYMDKYHKARREVVRLQADLAEANARTRRLGIMFDMLAKMSGADVKIQKQEGNQHE